RGAQVGWARSASSAIDPEEPQKGVLVRCAAEELREQHVGILLAPARQDVVAVFEAGLRIEDTGLLKPREHVVGEHLAPQIAVVPGVIAGHQMAEARS